MKKVVIYGAGEYGWICYSYFLKHSREYSVVGIFDSVPEKANEKFIKAGVQVLSSVTIKKTSFDQLIISVKSKQAIDEILTVLQEEQIPSDKIEVLVENKALLVPIMSSYQRYDEKTDLRVNWLRSYADFCRQQHLSGDVAECGVFRGEFSYYIHKHFPDSELYLFDTFSGFSECDIENERKMQNGKFLNGSFNNETSFSANSEEIVLSRLNHDAKVHVRKGYFPETAKGMEGHRFLFVNLDMDLYQPQLAGLNFFFDRMVDGGVILLHDYFHPELPGVKKAVDEFAAERKVNLFPIGDYCSIAILK